jgi:uncharacterized protein YkwD
MFLALSHVALCLALLPFSGWQQDAPAIGNDRAGVVEMNDAARLIFDQTNAFRREQGRAVLKQSEVLVKTAQDFAEFMAGTDKYGHDADGNQPGDRAGKHGYEACILAENIAFQFNSEGFETKALAQALVEGWVNSPGHRQNMLDPDVTEAGMGVARSQASGKYYAVQVFGRPKSESIKFSVANRTDEDISFTLGDQKQTLEAGYTSIQTMCRAEDLKFTWGEGEGQPVTLKPAGGETFVIRKKDGKFQVTTQKGGAKARD